VARRLLILGSVRASLSGCIAAALAGLVAVAATTLLTGCGTEGAQSDPNTGLLRDFLDGKFDGAGHPINARVTEAATLCPGALDDGRLAGACAGAIAGGEQVGDLVASARIRVEAHAASGDIVSAAVLGADGEVLASDTLTVDRLRDAGWLDLPVTWSSSGAPVQIRITPAEGAVVDLDYVEVFPSRFGLVLAPGSGVVADSARLTFEVPRNRKVDRISADGVDVTQRLNELLDAGTATRTTTSFRTVIDVGVGDLLPMRGDVTELRVDAGAQAARLQLRTTAPACSFEGSGATKVLVTGFQPFPADAWHDNVSGVAVTALDVGAVHDAQVMKLILPVEYDRAAGEVTDAIARCNPDIVISFGQGGDAIALEEVAYNLQDTGEVAGGVPDNRGVVRAAVPIDGAAPATRDTRLPLDAIEQALVALGESPQHSRDPGRYICNNVMFADLGTDKRAGFIHLPYTTSFDDATRARFGAIAAAAIQATVDQK
jgi:pyroglutamyl-peptidase